MKKESLIQFNDDLVLTYSLLQDNNVIIYIEKPNKDRTDFNSAEFLFPTNTYRNIVGFTDAELEEMRDRVEKGGRLALEWEKEKNKEEQESNE